MNAQIKIEETMQNEAPDILDEFLAYRRKAQRLNMDLPYRAPKYSMLECPHCNKVCAYLASSLSANCIHVCDWCEGEF